MNGAKEHLQMVGEVRYWFAGNAWALCLAMSDEFVTAAFWGDEGCFLRMGMMERRFWDRFWRAA